MKKFGVKIKFDKSKVLSENEVRLQGKKYFFNTEEEKNAFCIGLKDALGFSEYNFADITINNYQTQVIQAQINLLWHIRETHESDLTTNQISWIDDDITYVEVKYLNEPNDSSRADEYREEEPKTISFLEALELLRARLHNTMQYLEEIDDPDQGEE